MNDSPADTGMRQPKAGEQWMVKHPSANGTWQVCTIQESPTNAGTVLFAMFPDGTIFDLANLDVGGPVATETEPIGPDPITGKTAEVSPLNPEYETFRQAVVALNGQSRRMFQLPLSVLIVMVHRYAVEHEATGTGIMANYGGQPSFVPDQATFDKWIEDYLLEVMRRETGRSAE